MNAEFLFLCMVISFMITSIHVACKKGNILFKARNKVGNFLYKRQWMWLEKPLYDCLPCMASFWGLFFWMWNGFDFHPLALVLCVSGINCLIEILIDERIA